MVDFIQTIHKTTYCGIDAAAPPRTQRGKTVLITGGVRGIGFAIARAFAVANASTIILLSRGGDKLSAAEARLKREVPSFSGVVMTIRCDILDPEENASVWSSLDGRRVDVLILNAAYMGENQAVLQHSWRRVWEQYEVNVRGNLVLVDLFLRQGNTHDGQKKVCTHHSPPPYTCSNDADEFALVPRKPFIRRYQQLCCDGGPARVCGNKGVVDMPAATSGK